MKKSLIVLAVAASIVVAGLVGVAQAQKAKQVVYVSSEKATYTPRPGGGPSMQVLHGDPDKGPHATFTKFESGFDAERFGVLVQDADVKAARNTPGSSSFFGSDHMCR